MANGKFTGESYEQKERRKRAESARRIRLLGAVAVVAIIARVVVKDPVRPPPPDHSSVPVRILPGMLDSLPPSERAKLDPKLVAKLMLADEEARKTAAALKHGPGYRPNQSPESGDPLGEQRRQQVFAYAKRQAAVAKKREKLREEAESAKKTLIRFAHGRHLAVDAAQWNSRAVTIQMNGMTAELPSRMISSVMDRSKGWEEPVPEGHVRLKPANGITVILDEETARRVTVRKLAYDDI